MPDSKPSSPTKATHSNASSPTKSTHSISPQLSLDLRLRFLETLLSGSPRPALSSASTTSLTRRADLIQAQLREAIEYGGGGEAVRRFVQGYDLNEPLLRLPALQQTPTGEELTPLAKAALILESEAEIRQLEQELREIDTLDARGLVGAGKLPEHEDLKPQLESLVRAAGPLKSQSEAIEGQTNALLSDYNDYISTLSEIFISWNDIVSSAEEEVTRLEKARSRGIDID